MKPFLFSLLMLVLAGSAIHPFGEVRQQNSGAPLLEGATVVDARARQILERACQNCHSEKTAWPWYSHVPPMSWLIERDVAGARKRMNLSQWSSYTPEQRRELLAGIGVVVRTHQMPPAPYLMLHEEAKLTAEEVGILYKWERAERAADH